MFRYQVFVGEQLLLLCLDILIIVSFTCLALKPVHTKIKAEHMNQAFLWMFWQLYTPKKDLANKCIQRL